MDDRARSHALQGFYSPADDPTAWAALAREGRRNGGRRKAEVTPSAADEVPSPHDRVVVQCLRRVHFDVDPGSTGLARVRCRDCRSEKGEIVIHTFDLATGRPVGTERYRSVRELIEAEQPTGASGAGAQRGE